MAIDSGRSAVSRAGVRSTNLVLLMLCLMYGITYVDRVNISTAAAVFRHEMNLSNTQVGFVFSVFGYRTSCFRSLVGGWAIALARVWR